MVKRSAMTMIELIFAIVLIALVVAAVPQMIQRNDKTLEGNLVQEELFIAAKIASEILTQPWDANSPDTTTSRAYTKVLDTNSSNVAFNREMDHFGNSLPFRQGHIRQDNHRRFHNAATSPSTSGIPMGPIPSVAGMNITVTSGYCGQNNSNFFALAGGTTVSAAKMATITATDTADAARTVTLRIYMANIGEIAYAHRSF